jgi:hypothetical protein
MCALSGCENTFLVSKGREENGGRIVTPEASPTFWKVTVSGNLEIQSEPIPFTNSTPHSPVVTAHSQWISLPDPSQYLLIGGMPPTRVNVERGTLESFTTRPAPSTVSSRIGASVCQTAANSIALYGGGEHADVYSDLYFFDSRSGMWNRPSVRGLTPPPTLGAQLMKDPCDDNRLLLLGGHYYGPTSLDECHFNAQGWSLDLRLHAWRMDERKGMPLSFASIHHYSSSTNAAAYAMLGGIGADGVSAALHCWEAVTGENSGVESLKATTTTTTATTATSADISPKQQSTAMDGAGGPLPTWSEIDNWRHRYLAECGKVLGLQETVAALERDITKLKSLKTKAQSDVVISGSDKDDAGQTRKQKQTSNLPPAMEGWKQMRLRDIVGDGDHVPDLWYLPLHQVIQTTTAMHRSEPV